MNACESTASITTRANLPAEKLDTKQTTILVQLGNTLAAIAVQKDVCQDSSI